MQIIRNLLGIGLIAISFSSPAWAEETRLKPADLIIIFPWEGGDNPFPEDTFCEAVREIPPPSPIPPDYEDEPRWEFRCQMTRQSPEGSACSMETKILNEWGIRFSIVQTGLTEIPMASIGMDVVAGNHVVRAKAFARTQLVSDASDIGTNFYLIQDQNDCWHTAGNQAPPVQQSQFPADGFQLNEQVYIGDRSVHEEGIDPLNLPITETTVIGWAPFREYETCFDDTGAYCREYGYGAPGLPYPIWADTKIASYSYILANGQVIRLSLNDEGRINSYQTLIWRTASEIEIRNSGLPALQSRVVHLESGRILTIQNYLAGGPRCTDLDCYSEETLFSDASLGAWALWNRDSFSPVDDSFALNVRRNDRISGGRVVMNGTGEVSPSDEVITAVSDAAASYFVGKIDDSPNRYTLAFTESGKRYILASCEEDRFNSYNSPRGPFLTPLCNAERDEGRGRSIYAIPLP
jgi:hypothetical protein